MQSSEQVSHLFVFFLYDNFPQIPDFFLHLQPPFKMAANGAFSSVKTCYTSVQLRTEWHSFYRSSSLLFTCDPLFSLTSEVENDTFEITVAPFLFKFPIGRTYV